MIAHFAIDREIVVKEVFILPIFTIVILVIFFLTGQASLFVVVISDVFLVIIVFITLSHNLQPTTFAKKRSFWGGSFHFHALLVFFDCIKSQKLSLLRLGLLHEVVFAYQSFANV